MKRLSRFILKILCLNALVLSQIPSAFSHPHNWIELNTAFVLDEDVRLTKITQSWEFDVFYSMMTHADLLNEFSDEQAGFKETARRMINSLKSYDYFSELRIAGLKVELGMPETYRLYTKVREEQTVLILEMTFDIDPLLKVENKTLAWKVFDPTYFIAMNHDKESNIQIIGGNATECSKRLDIPEPSDEIIDYAQSLDKTQKNTDGLGERFAETVLIDCI